MLATALAGGLTLSSGAFAAPSSTASGPQKLVENAAQTIQQAKQDSHFDSLLKQAKGVFVVPSFSKGALVVGASGGEGVLVVRRNNAWGNPAFLSIGSISIGAQAGGANGPLVMLLMTNKAVNEFTQNNKFSFNGNAGLSVATFSTKAQTGTGSQDVIVWANENGAYAGVNVSGSEVTADNQDDQTYYGRSVTTQQIVNGRVSNAQADVLRNDLPA